MWYNGYGLVYISTKYLIVVGHIDLDWVGYMDDKKSTSCYTFTMGLATIAWSTKKQPIVSLSIAEAKYKEATTTTSEAIWLRIIL